MKSLPVGSTNATSTPTSKDAENRCCVLMRSPISAPDQWRVVNTAPLQFTQVGRIRAAPAIGHSLGAIVDDDDDLD
eukprot:5922290-Karenia_brevis.AAC.1